MTEIGKNLGSLLSFSTEEESKAKELIHQLSVNHTCFEPEYGLALQKRIAEFSEMALSRFSGCDLFDGGDIFSRMSEDLKVCSMTYKKRKNGLLRHIDGQPQLKEGTFDQTEAGVLELETLLCDMLNRLEIDREVLSDLYENNKDAFHELSVHIYAGHLILDACSAEQPSSDPDLQLIVKNITEDQIEFFSRRVHDLEIVRTMFVKLAPQIRAIVKNDAVMADKIKRALDELIPQWKQHYKMKKNNQINKLKTLDGLSDKHLEKRPFWFRSIGEHEPTFQSAFPLDQLEDVSNSLLNAIEDVVHSRIASQQARRLAGAELEAASIHIQRKLHSV